MTLERILEDVLSLGAEDRMQLVARLLESLEEDEGVSQSDWEQSWIGELNRRIASIENGTATTVPADAVFTRLRERVGG